MMFKQLPADIGSIPAWLSDWFIPFGFPQALVLGLLAAIIVFSYWRLNYYRQPAHDRLGDYIFTMPHVSETFKATVWALHLDKQVDQLIDGFEQFHTSDDKETFRKIAALLDDNRGIAHAYLLRYLDYEIASRRKGWALLISNAPLEDGNYYNPRESIKHLFGMPTKVQMLASAEFTSFIDDDAGAWTDGKGKSFSPCDHIYYSMQPINRTAKPAPELRTNAQVILAIAADAKQTILTLRDSKSNQIARDAAEDGQRRAESDARRYKAQADHERRQRVKKSYWAQELTTIGTPMSLALILVVIGGCAVLLPDTLARNLPGYTQTHYIAASVLIGGMIVWLIGHFSNRNAGE